MKKTILDYLNNNDFKPPSLSFIKEEPFFSYENKSSHYFAQKKEKASTAYERLTKSKPFFSSFFENYKISSHEIIEMPKNLTIGLIGIIDMEQTYSKDAIVADNLTNLIGANKFQNNSDFTNSDLEGNKKPPIYMRDKTGKIELIIDEKKVNWLTTESNVKEKKFKRSLLINGVIVGVLGETKDYHNFIVETLIFLGVRSSQKIKEKKKSLCKVEPNIVFNEMNAYKERILNYSSNYIMLISGFELNDQKPLYFYNLLMEFIKNGLFADKIIRIIIMGNFFDNFECLQTALQSATKNKDIFGKAYSQAQTTLQYMEYFLDSIVSSRKIMIDLMPGANDAQSPFLPQDSFENLNFLNEEKSFINCVSNPYFFSLNGLKILGTSGQNVKELKRYIDYSFEENTDLMENMCYWGNFCPKNSGGLEFQEGFDLEKTSEKFPRMFFTGNGKKFMTKTFFEENSGFCCKLITVPQFSQTHSCILVDIESFECFEINF